MPVPSVAVTEKYTLTVYRSSRSVIIEDVVGGGHFVAIATPMIPGHELRLGSGETPAEAIHNAFDS